MFAFGAMGLWWIAIPVLALIVAIAIVTDRRRK